MNGSPSRAIPLAALFLLGAPSRAEDAPAGEERVEKRLGGEVRFEAGADGATGEGAAQGQPPSPGPRTKSLPGRFGVRAGALLSTTGDARDYETNALLGAYYRPRCRDPSRMYCELGFDIGAREESAGYSSVPLGGRFDGVFPLAGDAGGAHAYFVAGGSGHVEFVESLTTGEEYTNLAGGANVGVGAAFARGRLDLRVTHEMLLGSGNLSEQTLVSVGFSF